MVTWSHWQSCTHPANWCLLQVKQLSKAGKVGSAAGALAAGAGASGASPPGEEAAQQASVFAGVSGSLGWPMFQLVLTTWLGQVDIPGKSELKQWELQVGIHYTSCNNTSADQSLAGPHQTASQHVLLTSTGAPFQVLAE